MANIERDQYWDSLKFVLIFLVVYGHTIGSSGVFNHAMYGFIYLFHMPLFIFISGRFSQIKDKGKYKKGILKLLETYIVFQILWRLFAFVSEKDFSQLFPKLIDSPWWILWYLFSLICWRTIIYLIPERYIHNQPLLIIPISLFIGIIGGFIPIDLQFSFQRTAAFFPFFVLGYYSERVDVKSLIKKIPIYIPILFLGILFIVIYLNPDVNFEFTKCKSSYYSDPEMSPILCCIIRCAFIAIATIISIMVMRLVPTNQRFAKWGTNTLFIFIYHAFFVQALNIAKKQSTILHNELLLFGLAVLFTMLLINLSRFKFFSYLLNPYTYMRFKSKRK